jgi:hypothetical protein
MYEGRIRSHEAFREWFRFVDALDPIRSVLEFGCGMAVGYADFFHDRRYVGADLVEASIDWCRAQRRNPRHEYRCCDFISAPPTGEFDLVFSQGTIDNTYDMDAFLAAGLQRTRRWLYVTAYRGFFPTLPEHVYTWHEEHGCYYNDISPVRAYGTLKGLGCIDVSVLPFYTGRDDIPVETLIVAKRA